MTSSTWRDTPAYDAEARRVRAEAHRRRRAGDGRDVQDLVPLVEIEFERIMDTVFAM
jgi:hypothetical protein